MSSRKPAIPKPVSLPAIRKPKSVSFQPTFKPISEGRDAFIKNHISKLRESSMSRNSSRLPRDSSYTEKESMRSETFIAATTKKPALLRDVDEEVWYEVTDGSGILKKKQDKLKIESIFAEPKGYDDMSMEDADKFVEMRMKKPVYEESGIFRTDQLLDKNKMAEKYEARLTKYKKIYHSIMVEFFKGFEGEIYNIIRDRLILKNKSPHFLFSYCSSILGPIDTWYGDDNLDYNYVLVSEKPHGKLYDYLTGDSDAEIPFFYWNVFFQALIALAQFHRSTGHSIRELTYDNLLYTYSEEFEGLPFDLDNPYQHGDDISEMLYYEYLFDNEDGPAYNFFTPALNINVILHGFGRSVPAASLKEVLKDYDKLFNLFIRKEHGGKMPDEVNDNNKQFSKTILSYKTKIMKAMLEQDVSPRRAAANMVFMLGEKIGLKKIKGVNFYEINQDEPVAINDDPFVI